MALIEWGREPEPMPFWDHEIAKEKVHKGRVQPYNSALASAWEAFANSGTLKTPKGEEAESGDQGRKR